ncbi:MAG TPA: hypothetical protein VH143_16915 [Kofleriaceae bacterium]|jgi:hypothetical protein|nr:hypothetical protein [Kofleriaceae bacterium]
MPRNVAYVVVAIASGCVFDAAYKSGQTTCSDGVCPSGLVCSAAQHCVTPGQGSDAGTTIDAMHDAHVAALTCADPGELTSSIAVMDSTVDRSNTVDPMCGGGFMNGPDAVYAIAIDATQSLNVALTGSAELAAYVVATCSALSCIGSAYASTSPIDVSPGSAGTYFVVVDSTLANGSGTYTLTVKVD